ncbi:hypothetical protein L1887_11623 [Cichorium endivia]|nr:hypothetical protein L1887_11623 [Cichorium endivia]
MELAAMSLTGVELIGGFESRALRFLGDEEDTCVFFFAFVSDVLWVFVRLVQLEQCISFKYRPLNFNRNN